MGVLTERLDHATMETQAHRGAVNALGEEVSGFRREVRDRLDLINGNLGDDRAEAGAFAGQSRTARQS